MRVMRDLMDGLVEHFDAHPGKWALRTAVTEDTAPACAMRLLMDYAWELKRQFFDADKAEWSSEAARVDHLLTITTVCALRRRLRGTRKRNCQVLASTPLMNCHRQPASVSGRRCADWRRGRLPFNVDEELDHG